MLNTVELYCKQHFQIRTKDWQTDSALSWWYIPYFQILIILVCIVFQWNRTCSSAYAHAPLRTPCCSSSCSRGNWWIYNPRRTFSDRAAIGYICNCQRKCVSETSPTAFYWPSSWAALPQRRPQSRDSPSIIFPSCFVHYPDSADFQSALGWH